MTTTTDEVAKKLLHKRNPHLYKRFDDLADHSVAAGPHDQLSIHKVLALIDELPAASGVRRQKRRWATELILEWLEFNGPVAAGGWQARWRSSGADNDVDWIDELVVPKDGRLGVAIHRDDLMRGLAGLLLCRIVFPSYGFLNAYKSFTLFASAREKFRPDLFAKVEAHADQQRVNANQRRAALAALSKIVLHTGKDLDALVNDDLLAYRAWYHRNNRKPVAFNIIWRLLSGIAKLSDYATAEEAVRVGQLSAAELVDAFSLQNQSVRDVIVRYLEERRASLDYASFDGLARTLAGRFWADIEHHHPDVESLHLPDDVASAWRMRARMTVTPNGVTERRSYHVAIFHGVRAFYRDIQEWALDDPSWVPYSVPSPVRKSDLAGYYKERKKTTAAMHQRIRDRLPQLPVLVDVAERHRSEQAALLEAVKAVPIDATFEHEGRSYRRTVPKSYRKVSYRSDVVPDQVEDVSSGEIIDVGKSEHEAFWAWAVIETLRHTGVRVEELMEITHLALVSYRLPKTREVVPMLQIVPSKTNEERLLLISPEFASVLATIVTRLRRANGGTIPLTKRYDGHERVTGPALPHLFQHRLGGAWQVPSANTIQKWLTRTLARTGLQDASGQPLHFTPHDFRRMFATDALTGGLPVHIVSRLLGHKHINTTQAYTAVFDEHLVRAYRTFLDSRRAQRPEEEYREPTDEEWREFQQHFELRKLELGTCGRPYGTPCKHEHACIRCPSLRVDPRARGRLTEIVANLRDRVEEARANGWTGEVEGLKVSLNAAAAKLASLDRMQARAVGGIRAVTDLGVPVIVDSP